MLTAELTRLNTDLYLPTIRGFSETGVGQLATKKQCSFLQQSSGESSFFQCFDTGTQFGDPGWRNARLS